MTNITPEPAGQQTPQESTESKKPDDAPAFKLSKKQKGLGLAALFAATALIPGPLGMPVRGLFGAAAEAPGMIYMMHKDEEMYLGNPKVADARNGTWTVDAAPYSNATEKDGIRFTVTPSLLDQAWSTANGKGKFRPEIVTAPIAPMRDGEMKKYKVTYHGTLRSLFESGPKDAVLLDVKEVPPEPPKTARSGIPFAWPPGTWNKAFSPF